MIYENVTTEQKRAVLEAAGYVFYKPEDGKLYWRVKMPVSKKILRGTTEKAIVDPVYTRFTKQEK